MLKWLEKYLIVKEEEEFTAGTPVDQTPTDQEAPADQDPPIA